MDPLGEDGLQALCKRCQKIDFEAIFGLAVEVPEDGNSIAEFSEDSDEPWQSWCVICHLLASTQKKLRKEGSIAAYSTNQRWRPSGVFVTVPEPPYPDPALVDAPHLRPFILPVAPSEVRERSYGLTGNIVLPNKINYELIRSWIRDCQAQHTMSCSQKLSVVDRSFMKVIDCASGQIIKYNADREYLALSYHWASIPISDQNPNSEPVSSSMEFNSFHEVVEDAIMLTLDLGIQYLWVDQYCIDQSSTTDKQLQISRMDQIYQGALATIIAVSRRDSHERLPEVTSRPGKAQASAITAGGTLLVTATPPSRKVFQPTEWNTRGWTYQGAMLSSRCLVLAEDQVYFFCKEISTSESVCGRIAEPAFLEHPPPAPV